MIGCHMLKKVLYNDMLSYFDTASKRAWQTDGQTDGRTELLYQYYACLLTRDKNPAK